MIDAVMMIAVSDIRPKCAGEPDLQERLRKAMQAAHDFWLSGDDNLRFKAACAAAMLETSDDLEKEQISRSSRMLAAVSAAMTGVPVDMEEAMNCDDGFVPLPLLGIWHETKHQ